MSERPPDADRGPENGPEREATLTDTFVRLADTLVDDYDVIDLLTDLSTTCVALFTVSSAGLLLDDGRGNLSVLAASTEDTRLLELFELQAEEGPCLDCLRSGQQVTASDLDHDTRWPRFVPRALDAGFHGVHALPLRLRSQCVGALNLFTATPGDLPGRDLRAAQGLADVATISILRDRSLRDQRAITTQLQAALHSRVIIEQAKGVLAERAGLDMATAFERLRTHARRTNRRLSDLAADVATLSSNVPPELTQPAPPRHSR